MARTAILPLDVIAIIWEVLKVPVGREERRVANALEVTDATFDAEVVQADKPVIVDFWAPWCAPCRAVGAVLEQLAGERDDLKVVKINIDDNQEQAMKNGVMVLPTIILYKGGEPVGKLQGGVPPTAIARLLNEHAPKAEPALAESEPAPVQPATP
jgi:thioredoxin 1